MENRRAFVKKVGLASVMLNPIVSFLARAFGISKADVNKLISFQCHLFRPKDLLDFEYSFINVNTNNWIVKKDVDGNITYEGPKIFSKIKFLIPSTTELKADGYSYMIVRIAQQHISELFFYLDQSNYDTEFISKVKYSIAKSFISGFSFLVFKIDFSKIGSELKFNSENLLCWNADCLELIVGKEISTQVTNPNYPLVIKDHFPFQKTGNTPFTTFELPYKLYLTPFPDKFIFSSNKLREKGNTVELWWNQIKSPSTKTNHPSFKVIGYENNKIYNEEDYSAGEQYLPKEADREELTNQFLKARTADKPEDEATTLDFRISSLGAITKIRYKQEKENFSLGDLVEWKQDINLGRDNYVEVVHIGTNEKGFKCKFIETGERKIKDGVSFVEYKYQIIPIEFTKTFFVPNKTDISGKPDNLRDDVVRKTPFQKISIIDKEFPYIIAPDSTTEYIDLSALSNDPDINKATAFWAKVKNTGTTESEKINELLSFTYEAVDWNGNKIYFKSCVFFARDILFRQVNQVALKTVAETYQNASNKFRREIDIAGQRIAYYKSEFKKEIDGVNEKIDSKISEIETSIIQFVFHVGTDFIKTFPFYPQLEAAYVQLPVIKQLIKDPRGVLVSYGGKYVEYGIQSAKENAEGILLKIREEKIDPATNKITYEASKIADDIFSNVSNQFAGVIKPEVVIQAISLYQQAFGLYEGCTMIINNRRSIAKAAIDEIFQKAKLLGEIELKRILRDSISLDNFPIAEFKELYDELKILEKILISYNWKSGNQLFENKLLPGDIIRFYNTNKGNSSTNNTDLTIDFNQEINIKLPSATKYNSETRLNNFGIGVELLGKPIITLYFNSILFSSATNQKPVVSVEISKVEFSGILELVKQLQESLGTFGKGLSFDIFGDKILVGYQFEVPAINSGAFNLSNIKLGFDFNLYFKKKPIDFWFRFSEREAPFLLSVGIFGGRGYFGIRVSSRQIEEVEALLEFGGYLGIDVGIARGCVFLFAGIFYRNTGGTTDLYGYVICGGVLNVLGIIELSMTFYLGMHSEGNSGSLSGTASVTVKIRLGFFKISRTASMTKRLTGSGGVGLNKSSDLFSAGMNKTKTLLDTSESDDTKFYDECDREIYVPDDSMLYDSLEIDELIAQYSNAYN